MLPPKTHLPPGPWTAKGNKVVDGYGNTIAGVMWRYNPTLVAQWVAELPSFADPQQLVQLEQQLADAREVIKELREDLSELKRQHNLFDDEA